MDRQNSIDCRVFQQWSTIMSDTSIDSPLFKDSNRYCSLFWAVTTGQQVGRKKNLNFQKSAFFSMKTEFRGNKYNGWNCNVLSFHLTPWSLKSDILSEDEKFWKRIIFAYSALSSLLSKVAYCSKVLFQASLAGLATIRIHSDHVEQWRILLNPWKVGCRLMYICGR